MKCPICGKDLELKNKQIGTNENGDPVFNEYAICRDCRKQWNLDKQRAKKAAAKKAAVSAKPAGETKAAPKPAQPVKAEPVKKAEETQRVNTVKPVRPKRRPQETAPDAPAKTPVKRRPPQEDKPEDKRYSNIPSEKVRTKREKAAKQGYEDMLATGAIGRLDEKKKPARVKDETKALSKSSVKKPAEKADDYDDYDDDYYDEYPRFRAMRIILGIISLLGFGYFVYRGFSEGLSNSAGSGLSSGIIFIILALCMLVSALLYFIMQKTNTVFAFLLPMVFYLGSGVFAFLKRGDDMQLLIAAVAGIVLAVISLILAITSRGGDDYDDDYDDSFDDDYDD